MKNILVKSSTREIKDYDKDFVLFNNAVVVSKDGMVQYIYSDLSSSECNVHQVEEIVDFVGNKYLYQDGAVVENPDYVEPQPLPEV